MLKSSHICYIHFDTLESTNTWAKQNAEALDQNLLTCITAQEQTAGKGRFLRKWISPRGQNVYATLYFCLPLGYKYVANLGQVLSFSCCRSLQEKKFFPQIKWPNDILLEGKKIAGILSEVVSFEDRLGVILGIGINVDMSRELLDTIDQPATSLAQLSGQTWSLEQILEPLLKAFLQDLNVLSKQGFEPFHKEFEKLLAFKGEMISCQSGKTSWEGRCDSINSDGTLNLLLQDGSKMKLSAGEVKFKTFRGSPATPSP